MARLLYTLFGVLLHGAIIITCDVVQVELFTENNCKGRSLTLDLDFLCTNLPSFGFEVSGVAIHKGSCVVLQKELTCNGETYILAYPDNALCTLPSGWNDNVLSVRDCDSREVDIRCPEGSYIRQIEYGEVNEGITVHCYEPNSNTSIYSENSHSKPPSKPIIKGCPIAAHGLSIEFNSITGMYHTPSMTCDRIRDAPTENKNVTGNHHKFIQPKRAVESLSEDNAKFTASKSNKSVKLLELCNEVHALAGITVTVDEGGTIKEFEFHCTKIVDPALMCDPEEMLSGILDCDNSESSSEITCSFSQTVGVGVSNTLTELERQEMKFSLDAGFSIDGEIPYLSGHMSSELKKSDLVEYLWSKDETTVWTEETTVTTSIKVPPNVRTKVDQLLGKCSFFGTSTNYFKATDINSTSGETTFRYFST